MITKKIHRIFVAAVILLGTIMAATGIVLKYVGDSLGVVRYIHGNMSPYFTALLMVMMATGAYMYIYPWYLRRKTKPVTGNQP